MNNSAVTMSLKEEHERFAHVCGSYTAFVAALLIATIAKGNEYPRAYIVITMLASSLPSLVALVFLDHHVSVVQTRKKSAFRGLAALLGFVPSLLGIATLIGHFSLTGGVLFLLLTFFWFLCIFGVVLGAAADPHSTI
jgi:predicted membrane channel-forming protein YqfA (hemolysin III family)